MGIIVQQTNVKANLIELPLHVYSHYRWILVVHSPDSVGPAFDGACLSLYMARCRWRRIAGLGQRFLLADPDADPPGISGLGTGCALFAVTQIYSGWDRLGFFIEHRYALFRDHPHFRGAE